MTEEAPGPMFTEAPEEPLDHLTDEDGQDISSRITPEEETGPSGSEDNEQNLED
jgi:hypothetical protein